MQVDAAVASTIRIHLNKPLLQLEPSPEYISGTLREQNFLSVIVLFLLN